MTWRRVQLKQVASVSVSNVDKKTSEHERPVRLCNYVDVYKHDLIDNSLDFMRATASPSEIRSFGLRAGDTVITKDSETAEDIAVPAYVGETIHDLVCGYHLAVIRPGLEVDPKYLFWCLSSAPMREQAAVAATGVTRFGLRQESIRNALIDVPSLSDQRRISDFLDAESARMDALVHLRLDQVAAIEERASACVDLLVREGAGHTRFDSAEFRPLGRVPQQWRQARLRNLRCEVQTGPFGSQLHADEYVVGAWPVINPANLQGQRLVPDPNMTVDDMTRVRLSRHILRAGDVVFGRRGELGRAGLVGPEEEGWICGTGSLRVRFRGQEFDPAYLAHYLRIAALRHYFLSQSVGSTMDNLNTQILLRMPILIPPLPEQAQIASACDAALERARVTADALRRSIDLLREHQAALVTTAITGQLDVTTARGAA